jgi:DNA polymerase (family 10)
MLWHEARITTVDELEAAARSGRLSGLPRLGERSVEKVLRALEQRRESSRAPRARAEDEQLAAELVGAARRIPAVTRAEVAGSYRRGRERVGDLDIVAATTSPSAAVTAFAALPEAELVIAQGGTKCSVEVHGGFQVDLRAVAPEEFGAALQYFTGSQAHNVQLRGRALRLGMTLNEYGVFVVETGARVAGASEESVYAALGLRWIPPELREGRGEIQEAAQGPASVRRGAAVEV